jgi:hypothetical protein
MRLQLRDTNNLLRATGAHREALEALAPPPTRVFTNLALQGLEAELFRFDPAYMDPVMNGPRWVYVEED